MITVDELIDTKALLRLANYALMKLKKALQAREVRITALPATAAFTQRYVELTANDLERFKRWPCDWPDELIDGKLAMLADDIFRQKGRHSTLQFAVPQLPVNGAATSTDPETGMSLRVQARKRETSDGPILEGRLDIIFCWSGETA